MTYILFFAFEIFRLKSRRIPVDEGLPQLLEKPSGGVFILKLKFQVDDLRHEPVHVLLPVGRGRLIGFIESVLLQINGVKKIAFEIVDEFLNRNPFLADDLHHLVDVVAFFEDRGPLTDMFGFDEAGVFTPAV